MNPGAKVVDARRAGGGCVLLRRTGKQVQGVMHPVHFHHQRPGAIKRQRDAVPVDRRTNAARSGSHHHGLHGSTRDHLDLHRPGHVPDGESGEFGLVDRPLVSRPDLVERHRRNPARIDGHGLPVDTQAVVLAQRLAVRSRPGDDGGRRRTFGRRGLLRLDKGRQAQREECEQWESVFHGWNPFHRCGFKSEGGCTLGRLCIVFSLNIPVLGSVSPDGT